MPGLDDTSAAPAGTARRTAGVLFFGLWTIFFGVMALLLAAVLATGADNPGEVALLAVVCAGIAVFNGRRLVRRLRR